jgi:hypothetical protein
MGSGCRRRPGGWLHGARSPSGRRVRLRPKQAEADRAPVETPERSGRSSLPGTLSRPALTSCPLARGLRPLQEAGITPPIYRLIQGRISGGWTGVVHGEPLHGHPSYTNTRPTAIPEGPRFLGTKSLPGLYVQRYRPHLCRPDSEWTPSTTRRSSLAPARPAGLFPCTRSCHTSTCRALRRAFDSHPITNPSLV